MDTQIPENSVSEKTAQQANDTPTLEASAKKFIDLEYEKRRLNAELKSIEEMQGAVKDALLLKFQQGEMTSFTARGLTVYLHRQLWAGLKDGKDKVDGCTALRAAGLGDLVNEGYNSQGVSGRFREFGEDEEGKPVLPPELSDVWRMNEVFDVRAKKA